MAHTEESLYLLRLGESSNEKIHVFGRWQKGVANDMKQLNSYGLMKQLLDTGEFVSSPGPWPGTYRCRIRFTKLSWNACRMRRKQPSKWTLASCKMLLVQALWESFKTKKTTLYGPKLEKKTWTFWTPHFDCILGSDCRIIDHGTANTLGYFPHVFMLPHGWRFDEFPPSLWKCLGCWYPLGCCIVLVPPRGVETSTGIPIRLRYHANDPETVGNPSNLGFFVCCRISWGRFSVFRASQNSRECVFIKWCLSRHLQKFLAVF